MDSVKKFEHVYKVRGMHCASCEILLEKKIIEIAGITSVDASVGRGEVKITYTAGRPTIEKLNEMFKIEGYQFFNSDFKKEKSGGWGKNFLIALIIISAFLYLNHLGLSSLVNVNSSSNLAGFFIFGILAGLSTCAALVGGLVLSMSKQWSSTYASNSGLWQKMQPHLMFNAGRLFSYCLGGMILGAIGGKLQISPSFTSLLVLLVSFLMLFLGLQMMGLSYFQRFQIRMPRFVTRKFSNEKNFSGKQMPFLLGAGTFFLPCGFTITSQGLALLSGSFWQGSLIMLFFALGTAPMLFLIGLSSIKFVSRPHTAAKFLKIAGLLVLFFALFNINAQLNVLGWPSISDWFNKNYSIKQVAKDDSLSLIGGEQVIKMEASTSGYQPNYFKIKVGVPVRWEIKDTGTSGCTNAIIARGLFSGQIELTPGETAIKEFTPLKVGRYKFSCWMGMINGIIDVVE